MDLRRAPELLGNAEVLDRPADGLSGVVRAAVGTGVVKDTLSGAWLGHVLHPMLTDLPIGFWTSAWVLDIIGGKASDDAARKLVGYGVLTALPTAAAGLADWSDTTGPSKRVGLVHAAANSVALGCYAASWVARRSGRRSRGIAWGWAGAAAATAGGYLGGHLVSRLGIGVDSVST